MSSELIIRAVARHDHEQWLPLWDGYNAFYGRSGPTALDPEVTQAQRQRAPQLQGGGRVTAGDVQLDDAHRGRQCLPLAEQQCQAHRALVGRAGFRELAGAGEQGPLRESPVRQQARGPRRILQSARRLECGTRRLGDQRIGQTPVARHRLGDVQQGVRAAGQQPGLKGLESHDARTRPRRTT